MKAKKTRDMNSGGDNNEGKEEQKQGLTVAQKGVQPFRLDILQLADVLSTSGSRIPSFWQNGRLLKLVDRADLGSVGDEP